MTIARAAIIFLVTCIVLVWVAIEIQDPRDCYDPTTDTRFECEE